MSHPQPNPINKIGTYTTDLKSKISRNDFNQLAEKSNQHTEALNLLLEERGENCNCFTGHTLQCPVHGHKERNGEGENYVNSNVGRQVGVFNPTPQDSWKEAVNNFIKHWCGDYVGHLLDSDENDGERLRRLLGNLLTSARQEEYQRGAKEARGHYYDKVRREAILEERERIKGIIHEVEQKYHDTKYHNDAEKALSDILSKINE